MSFSYREGKAGASVSVGTFVGQIIHQLVNKVDILLLTLSLGVHNCASATVCPCREWVDTPCRQGACSLESSDIGPTPLLSESSFWEYANCFLPVFCRTLFSFGIPSHPKNKRKTIIVVGPLILQVYKEDTGVIYRAWGESCWHGTVVIGCPLWTDIVGTVFKRSPWGIGF